MHLFLLQKLWEKKFCALRQSVHDSMLSMTGRLAIS